MTGSPALVPPAAPRGLDTESPSSAGAIAGRLLTILIVIGPIAFLAVGIPLLWGRLLGVQDVIIAVVFYAITGFGITVGFHRLFSHRSFRANRPLKVLLAAAGSMGLEGSPISWVANHRRHHMFSDKAGDPHSPHGHGTGVVRMLRGLLHAHVGWLFTAKPTSQARFAPDMLGDRDLVVVNRLFPVFAIGSLALPFGIGWAIGGVRGGITALLWAGVVRMALLHHMTWSVNSICHVFGRRPFATADRSTNFAPLAVLSFGESWHNYHHAHPSSARHGALAHQVDPSAGLIRWFERAGWATHVRWPRQPS